VVGELPDTPTTRQPLTLYVVQVAPLAPVSDEFNVLQALQEFPVPVMPLDPATI
jgi:hypothetical protein